MPAKQEVSSFIRSTFRSVWALELLCFLKKHRDRAWPQRELVVALRGSDLVVSQSIESLLAAGLVVIEPGISSAISRPRTQSTVSQLPPRRSTPSGRIRSGA
ncbi:hypothetical protein PIB19_07545 [Sphingomonas sp. 7/4-4]|uniref:hypothetical protein n=1 Tax=Sphingomonas sp. 7/4-4 TaxID=3018446 RepID=UPI0022F3A47D|nr:hypothetical protein [Sphingomonas sp. 7/4-4]WBY09186.1 hypothetical protein PIB19_07545 [Sphingomonas sp. 7/4-4]